MVYKKQLVAAADQSIPPILICDATSAASWLKMSDKSPLEAAAAEAEAERTTSVVVVLVPLRAISTFVLG
jgi:hypothetical protein